MGEKRVMRDAFLGGLHRLMSRDDSIFLLSADFGSPRLDAIRAEFRERFINVGIAEQNLVNVAAGLALEGFKVCAYAIAPFLTMRAYEQIRVNLALQGQLRRLDVSLVGVGAGLGYDVSGPTHHCLEDLTIMRALPNMAVLSPSDWVMAEAMALYALSVPGPKYLRLEGKPVARIYDGAGLGEMEGCFRELARGEELCMVSTGYMTHTALEAARILKGQGIKAGVVDVYRLAPFDAAGFVELASGYSHFVTLEEGFVGKGGLDSLVSSVLIEAAPGARMERMGFAGGYLFELGGRDRLHAMCGLDPGSVAAAARKMLEGV